MDQFRYRSGIEAVTGCGNVSQKAGAGGVLGVKELARAADRVLLAGQEMLVILGREEGRLVVIEPPRDVWRGRVLEIDDGILVAGELALVKKRTGAMDQAVILISGACGDALAVEAREQRGRASSVETFVVIENANPQELSSS